METKKENALGIFYSCILILVLICVALGYSVYQEVKENGYISIDEADEYNSNRGYPNTTGWFEEYKEEQLLEAND